MTKRFNGLAGLMVCFRPLNHIPTITHYLVLLWFNQF